MTKDEEKCHELIAKVYERNKAKVRVSPSWLATEAMVSIDPHRELDPMVYIPAHLQYAHWARALCRTRWEHEGNEAEQHELFPDLQKRYPAARYSGETPVYVLLEHMSRADVRFNVDRLRRESAAKAKHADRLEDWWTSQVKTA